MSEWIEWKGGECPVAEKSRLVLRLRGGVVFEAGVDGNLRWNHTDGHTAGELVGGDIIAYRIVEPEQEHVEKTGEDLQQAHMMSAPTVERQHVTDAMKGDGNEAMSYVQAGKGVVGISPEQASAGRSGDLLQGMHQNSDKKHELETDKRKQEAPTYPGGSFISCLQDLQSGKAVIGVPQEHRNYSKNSMQNMHRRAGKTEAAKAENYAQAIYGAGQGAAGNAALNPDWEAIQTALRGMWREGASASRGLLGCGERQMALPSTPRTTASTPGASAIREMAKDLGLVLLTVAEHDALLASDRLVLEWGDKYAELSAERDAARKERDTYREALGLRADEFDALSDTVATMRQERDALRAEVERLNQRFRRITFTTNDDGDLVLISEQDEDGQILRVMWERNERLRKGRDEVCAIATSPPERIQCQICYGPWSPGHDCGTGSGPLRGLTMVADPLDHRLGPISPERRAEIEKYSDMAKAAFRKGRDDGEAVAKADDNVSGRSGGLADARQNDGVCESRRQGGRESRGSVGQSVLPARALWDALGASMSTNALDHRLGLPQPDGEPVEPMSARMPYRWGMV